MVGFDPLYASDSAVTRHVAEFLQRHRDAGWPDALLLDAGVFRAQAFAERLAETLAGWLPPRCEADPRAPKRLRADLESLLGPRERWPNRC